MVLLKEVRAKASSLKLGVVVAYGSGSSIVKGVQGGDPDWEKN